MKQAEYLPHEGRQGSALLLSLIFIVVFAAMAIAMASMSGGNVQMANNQRKLDNSRGAAESGLDVLRYWVSKVEMSGTTAPSLRFQQMATSLQDALSDASVTNITPICDGSVITIPSVMLQSSSNQSFTAVFTKIDDTKVQLDVTGHYGPITRTIRTNYIFGIRANNVFDFGVASKGPVSLSGNVDLSGVNINVESNAYIECDPLECGTSLALSIVGNSQIAGRVKIVNPLAYVYLQGGQAGIGGVTGEEAMQPPYTLIGAGPTEFPEMHPEDFYSYATNTLSPTANLGANATYDNLLIPPNTNPNFTGHATLRGVLYVQTPNVVTFSGGVTITGIIVTNGSPTDDSATNKIVFSGDVISYPIGQLPQEPQFAGLQEQTGTFMVTPGFSAEFGGTFGTLNGVIAANGIKFYGNAGGTIDGSIINYANNVMLLSGHSDLMFNRSGLVEVPAGFVPQIVLHYDPSTYSEVTL
jgi:Tfp pilus assembly protein PilX